MHANPQVKNKPYQGGKYAIILEQGGFVNS
jgi:hypothetical protein